MEDLAGLKKRHDWVRLLNTVPYSFTMRVGSQDGHKVRDGHILKGAGAAMYQNNQFRFILKSI